MRSSSAGTARAILAGLAEIEEDLVSWFMAQIKERRLQVSEFITVNDCTWPVGDPRPRPALRHHTSVCSAISSASSTSIPRYRIHGTRTEVAELMVSMSVLLVIGPLLAPHNITGYITGHTSGENP